MCAWGGEGDKISNVSIHISLCISVRMHVNITKIPNQFSITYNRKKEVIYFRARSRARAHTHIHTHTHRDESQELQYLSNAKNNSPVSDACCGHESDEPPWTVRCSWCNSYRRRTRNGHEDTSSNLCLDFTER